MNNASDKIHISTDKTLLTELDNNVTTISEYLKNINSNQNYSQLQLNINLSSSVSDNSNFDLDINGIFNSVDINFYNYDLNNPHPINLVNPLIRRLQRNSYET